ncbi:MAG: hypothetical protein ACOX4T_01705 [Acetivibrionales bacterium]
MVVDIMIPYRNGRICRSFKNMHGLFFVQDDMMVQTLHEAAKVHVFRIF